MRRKDSNEQRFAQFQAWVREQGLEAVYTVALESRNIIEPEVVGYTVNLTPAMAQRFDDAFEAMIKGCSGPYGGWVSHLNTPIALAYARTADFEGETAHQYFRFKTCRYCYKRFDDHVRGQCFLQSTSFALE